MLKWPRSLAVRGVAALLLVNFLTIAIGLGFGVLEGRPTRLGGADVALEFAEKDLRFDDGVWLMKADGDFTSLRSRNPNLWLVAAADAQVFVVGSPPDAVLRTVGLRAGPSNAGIQSLLSEALIKQRRMDGRPVLLAAGGVDPDTVTSMDVLRTFSVGPAVATVLGLSLLATIALLVARPLLSTAIRPVVREAAALRPDEIGRRLDEARAPVELAPLVRAFNQGLDRLDLELGRRKRLISNVAHELRTPLAVLALRVDTLDAPLDQRESLRGAVHRITRLVEQMLDLERLSLPPGPATTLDLAQVAREVVADLAPMAMAAGYDIAVSAPAEPVVVTGQHQAIERAVTNLVQNAIQHGGGSGAIEVAVGRSWLEVADQGPGVSPDVQPGLFDAFVKDPAGGGSGLGLHLTREVMRASGGDISWSRQGGATIFRLDFSGLRPRQTESNRQPVRNLS